MAANLELLVQVQDRELQSLRKDIRTLSREMGGISTTNRRASASYTTLNREAGKANKSLTQATRGALAGSGAFRGLGRAVAFSSAAFLGAAGLSNIIRGAIDELEAAGQAAAQTNTVIKDTGEIAGVTAKHVDDLAKSLLKKSGVDDEAIKSAENLLLAFTNIRNVAGQGNDVFDQATKSTLDLSIAMHRDLNSTALALGKALQDPIKGMTALRRVGVTFTAAQTATVKKLIESNRVLDAQKLILDEVRKRSEGAAKAYGNTLPGQIDKARESFRNLSAEAIKPLLPDIARAADAAAKFFEKPSTERQLREAVQTAADAFTQIAGAIGQAKDALGGWKNTIKLLIALKVGSTVAGWATNIGLLTTSIGGAKEEKALGRVTKLRGALAGLKGLGVISVVVGLELVLTNKGTIEKWGNAIDATLDNALKNVPGFDKSWLHRQFIGAGVFGHKDFQATTLNPGRAGMTPALSAAFPGIGGSPFQAGPRGGPSRTGRSIAGFAKSVARSPGADAAGFSIPGGDRPGPLHQDCSSFTQAVFRKYGISIGGNTYSQQHNGFAVQRNQILPGDLLFFTYPGERRPGHVAIYVGGGMMVHDHGQSGGVQQQAVDWAHFNFARRVLTNDVFPATKSGGGGEPAGAAPPTAGLAPKTKKKKRAGAAASELLPQAIRLRIAEAEGTKGIKDDVAALHAASKFLSEALTQTKRNSEKRIQIQEELNRVDDELASLTKPKAKKKTAAGELIPVGLRTGLSRAEGTKSLQDDLKALRNIQTFLTGALKGTKGEKRLTILDELNNVKDRISGVVRDILDKAKSEVEKHRTSLGTAFGKVADSLLSSFDEKTSQLVDGINASFDALTPAEQELLGIQGRARGRERVALAATVEKAQKRLDRATGRRRATAQRDLDEARDALREFDLTPIADAERAAAEKRRTAALDATDKQRADERKALEDKIAAFQAMLEKGGLDMGTAFAKGILAGFPAFKKAVDQYGAYLEGKGLTGTPGSGTTGKLPIDPAIATAIRGSSGGTRAFQGASATTPVIIQGGTFIGTNLDTAAADIAEALAKYNRRNGRQPV